MSEGERVSSVAPAAWDNEMLYTGGAGEAPRGWTVQLKGRE